MITYKLFQKDAQLYVSTSNFTQRIHLKKLPNGL